MHHIKQRIILKKLAGLNGQRYSDLFLGFRYEDKFAYHLKQLLKKGLIFKEDRKYFISQEGLLENSKIDNETYDELRYKVPQALFICHYEGKYLLKNNNQNSTDFQTFMYGIPGMTCKQGDSFLLDMCKRVLAERYFLKGDIQFQCIQHYAEYSKTNDLIFDNILLIFDVNVKEILQVDKKLTWLSIEELQSIKNLHSTIEDFILKKGVRYSERIFVNNMF